ncbi:ribonuclease toxin immunity protein CdiI [Corallococcus aberystwythensis]|uniref:ribonuclease toxin immunity protein CdiI n=1 Tax=Corallococcus aberystwythensis TaxID=2316722 RepID=UPI00131562BF|nr:ribonuclease toxin immunity protein CdiI [Corallococcus aberystwythensis]
MGNRVQLVSDTDRLFPVQAFFNGISGGRFVQVMRDLVAGVSYFLDVASCEFPGSLDPWEERFDGVRFSLFEEVVVVDYDVFVRFAVAACRAHVEVRPEHRAELESILGGLPGFVGL